jgi:ribonucleoside-diphosphate reductase alpha chain
MFCIEYDRMNYGEDISIKDPTFQLYCDTIEAAPAERAPSYFVDAHTLTPEEHLKVMAACQRYIDSSISKTINLPKDIAVKEMEHVYLLAYEMGCKGCTVYREGSLDEEVLKKKDTHKPAVKVGDMSYDLDGKRYKVKIPDSKHAFYLNFSHSVDDNGGKRPLELFLNTKDPTIEEWTKAIGRLVSAVFRNVEDPTFLAEEMKEVYGQSGFWSARRRMWVPSLVAEFGYVLQDYFVSIGIIEPEVPIAVYEEQVNGSTGKPASASKLGYCRVCGKHSMVFQEGCPKCINPACLFTRC